MESLSRPKWFADALRAVLVGLVVTAALLTVAAALTDGPAIDL